MAAPNNKIALVTVPVRVQKGIVVLFLLNVESIYYEPKPHLPPENLRSASLSLLCFGRRFITIRLLPTIGRQFIGRNHIELTLVP